MKRIWTTFLLVSSGFAADLTVYTTGDGLLPPTAIYTAKDQATRMFGAVGVHLAWREGTPGDDRVAVQIRFAAANGSDPGAMAFAQPFDPEPVIVVFSDRIAAATERRPDLRTPFLAHVLVHEIGHVLLRTNAHAFSGVMKAHWSAADLSEMARRPLLFLPGDAGLIQSNLAPGNLKAIESSRHSETKIVRNATAN